MPVRSFASWGLIVAVWLAAPGANAGWQVTLPVAPEVRVVHGPRFLTGDPEHPEAAALAIDADGQIVAVLDELPPPDVAGERLELPGVLAVPGLHDAHIHLESLGRAAEQVDLIGSTSVAEVLERIQAFTAERGPMSVLRGRGWDQSLFAGGHFPSWRDLEPLGDQAVALTRVDGHAVWVNRTVLEAAGIGPDTADPEGGRILRGGSGEATGILIDNAMGLIWDQLPAASATDRQRWLAAGAHSAARAGLVAAHDMGVAPASYGALQELDAAGQLPLRVFVYLDGDDPRSAALFGQCGQTTGRVTLMGIKLFTDGAMGSRGAALLADYSDEPGHAGLLVTTERELEDRIRAAHDAGCQVAIHAIGDRGNRVALDAIEGVQGSDRSLRHRIEHAQLVHLDDFARFRDLGVTASMQPTHATSDMRWAEARVGAERLAGAYAWRTMLQTSVPLAFGSDAPVEDERPALGIYAALTRQDADGQPAGGWTAAQRLTVEEAIGAFSAGAAYAVRRETDLGQLRVGHRFDLTIYDRDPRSTPGDWLRAEVIATVIGGTLQPASDRQ